MKVFTKTFLQSSFSYNKDSIESFDKEVNDWINNKNVHIVGEIKTDFIYNECGTICSIGKSLTYIKTQGKSELLTEKI